jgi:hypothetical protein
MIAEVGARGRGLGYEAISLMLRSFYVCGGSETTFEGYGFAVLCARMFPCTFWSHCPVAADSNILYISSLAFFLISRYTHGASIVC